MRSILNPILLILLVFSSVTQMAYGQFSARAAKVSLIEEINSAFRSSSSDIEATVLMSEAFPKIGSQKLKALAQISLEDIVTSALQCRDCRANKAVVENLIKIKILAEICQDLCFQKDVNRQVSETYFKLDLEKLLKDVPAISSANINAADFDYNTYQLAQKEVTSPLDNDLYNFKMAGTYFALGMHETHQSTFRLFSRGHKNRNYLVAMGQDQVIDMIQNLRFTDAHITTLKNHPDFKHLPPEFFEYLRNFKFTGSGLCPWEQWCSGTSQFWKSVVTPLKSPF